MNCQHQWVEVLDREEWGMSGTTPVEMRYTHLECSHCARRPKKINHLDTITEVALYFLLIFWVLNLIEWILR